MIICWDNLENIVLMKNGKFRKNRNYYYYKEKCKGCGEPFLFLVSSKGNFCSNKCQAINYNPLRNGHSKETRKKMSEDRIGKGNSFYNKHHTEKSKKQMSERKKGFRAPKWKGGYTTKEIPLYDTYKSQLDWCESVRRNKVDKNILEVKCAYCGKWYIPTRSDIKSRIGSINGKKVGESRLYCSEGCKQECPIYGKTPETLMKEDAIRAGRLSWLELNREVQPELRQMVLKRDDYTCVKCGSKESLHCHHIEGIRWEPLESADVDKCITVCKECHKTIHKIPGCGYNDMRCNEI